MKSTEVATVADEISRILWRLGIRRVYGCPGSTELSLLAAARRCGLEYYFLTHEFVAVGMADGYARVSGQLAVVNLHASQGLLNAAGFIRVALRDRVPLLVLAGVPSTTYDVHEPNHFTAGLQQCLSPITKWAWTLMNPEAVGDVLRRAVTSALAPPQGPVVICIPQDVLETGGQSEHPAIMDDSCMVPSVFIPTFDHCRRIARVLVEARRPVIFAGFGARSACREVEALAEKLSAPVIAESLDRGTQVHHVYCGTDHEWFMGFFDSREKAIMSCLSSADVLVFIGARAIYSRVIGQLPTGCIIIQLTDCPCEIRKDIRVDIPAVGDIGATLDVLCQQLDDFAINPWAKSPETAYQQAHRSALADHRRERARTLDDVVMQGCPIGPLQLTKAIVECIDASAILVDDSQCMGYYIKRYLPFRRSGSLYGSMAGHLGWGMPAALGVKQARPGNPVVCLLGDTSFLFAMQGLTAATAYSIPVLLIIANNHGSVSLRKELYQRHGPDEYLRKALAFNDTRFDLSRIAEAMGVKGLAVTDASELRDALRRGYRTVADARTTCVIDVQLSDAWPDWGDSWYVVGAR